MKQYLIVTFIILVFIACTNKSKKAAISTKNQPEPIRKTSANKHSLDTLIDEFIDSLNIGISGNYKVDLKKFRNGDSTFVKILFFEKHSKWIEKQMLAFDIDDVPDCDMETADFNNDGLKDMTFKSLLAARGANEVRKLFIFNKTKGKLVYIRNSEDYPNMLYNKKLDCIDALLVSGSFYTAFLHLEKDSLKEFVGIDLRNDKINIITTDKYGRQKDSIIEKKNTFGEFVRFKNFKPLQAY